MEDLCQEVFLLAFRKWQGLTSWSVRAWLFVVAGYVAGSYKRLARHRRERLEGEGAGITQSFDPGVIDEERRFERFWGRLSEKNREVFVRFAVRNQSTREIALALGIGEQAVYARLKAAREVLGRVGG